MSKCFFTLFIACFLKFSYTQNYVYHSLIDTTIAWNTSNNAPLDASWSNTLRFQNNDTIITNKLFKKLVKSESTWCDDCTKTYYLREENKKFFLFKDNVEYLLYDFNALEGDTIWRGGDLPNTEKIYYYIKYSGLIEIDGELRKQFLIESNWVSYSGNKEWKWIEGIGDTELGVLGFSAPDIGYNYKLCNVTKNKSTIFPEDEVNCSSRYYSYSIERDKVRFYPNPATDFVSLHTLEGLEGFKIYDVTGRLRLICPRGTKKLDISSLERGVYYTTRKMFGPNLQLRFVKL